MRKRGFTDEQIPGIVREAEAGEVLDVRRRHGVSKNTLARWRARYRGRERGRTPGTPRATRVRGATGG